MFGFFKNCVSLSALFQKKEEISKVTIFIGNNLNELRDK